MFVSENTIRIPVELGTGRVENYAKGDMAASYVELGLPATQLVQHNLTKTQLHRFHRVMLHVEPGKPLSHEPMLLVRFLRNIRDQLRDKHVVVTFEHLSYWHEINPSVACLSSGFKELVRCTTERLIGTFEIIRCRTFEMAMVPETEYAGIKAIVEGIGPVYDLPA